MTQATAKPNGSDRGPTHPPSLRERTRRVLGEDGLTQARAAVEIGISDAALSQWLRGKYGGDEAAVEEKVERWLASRAERTQLDARLPAAPEWVDTPTSRRILSGLTYAQMAGDLAVVYGGAGLGKTLSARRYESQHPNVWVATMTPSTYTHWSCLERTAAACGLRAAHARAARIEADLIERLEGTHGLLVVDEAQHLGTRALDGLRALHDATGVGLALVGNEHLYARLTGGRRAAEFAQLFSRIGKRVRLTRPLGGDVNALVAAWGVAETGACALARGIARRPGGLRGLTKTLRLASMFADGVALAEAHLRAAWRDLGGEE